MAEFTLPKNSKINKGNSFNLEASVSNSRTFIVYRYDPDTGDNPRLDAFELKLDLNLEVIEFLNSFKKMKQLMICVKVQKC